MNCFHHRDVTAIGVCKSCGKGICADCAAELSVGLACKGSCESNLDTVNRMFESDRQFMRSARSQVKTNGIMNLAVGIGCLIFAIWSYFEIGSFFPYFLGLYGMAAFITGMLRLSRKHGYSFGEKEQNPPESYGAATIK